MFDKNLLAQNLKKYRTEHRLTQSEIAQQLYVTAQSVSKWERGEVLPDIAHLSSLSRIFSVSIDTLVGSHPPQSKGLIGIDSGGTKTEFVLINESGRILSSTVLPGGNPNVCGIEEAFRIFREGIDSLRPSEMNVCGIFLGGAGLFSGNNADILRTRLRSAYPHIKIDCGSDILNVIACCSEPERCIAAICGTGSVAFSYVNGTLTSTGGAGYRFDHCGSGYDIGRAALTAALYHRDGTGEETCLTRMVEEQLGGAVWNHLSELYKKDVSYIASFAPLVLAAYEQGDPVAQHILDENSRWQAHLICSAWKKTPSIRTVALSGSLYRKSSLFCELVTKKFPPHLKPELISYPPVWGACLRCAKLCDLPTLPSADVFMTHYTSV